MADERTRRYLTERAQLIGTKRPGTEAAGALCALTDGYLRDLARAAFSGHPGPWALVALGGYGAGRLLPRSDLDLLVLSDARAAEVNGCAQRLFYPLWDAGLKVGNQVRPPAAHARQVDGDLPTLTATLTARPLAGDAAYAARAIGHSLTRVRKHPQATLAALGARERSGSPYLLEPDLKDGAGGQRDIDELVWRAALAAKPLDRWLGDPARAAGLALAQDRITAARWRLRTPGERERLAPDDGIADAALHAALARVDRLLRAVRAGAPDPRDPWDARRLLRALESGADALPGLLDAAGAGLLDALMPGLAGLMTLRRPALGHRYTVGAHSVLAASLATGVARGDPLARELLGEEHDPRALLAAALAHDAGKAQPGPGHADRGVAPAVALARALGLDEDAAMRAGRLVRDHLLLAGLATTRDPDDPAVTREAAERISDAAALGELYALTVVDSRATGEHTWSEWSATLVRRAVRDIAAALRAPDARDASRAPGSPPAADAALAAEVVSSGERTALAMRVGTGPVRGSARLAVAIPVRADGFALLTGCLALVGLDIMEASADVSADAGLYGFTVCPATGAALDHAVWGRFERFARAGLADNLALGTRLAERRRHYDRDRREGPVHVSADVAGPRAAVLQVSAPDRIGLLHDIAAEVLRAGLLVERVQAVTVDRIVRDVLFLDTPAGDPAPEPGVLGHLAMALRERCDS